MRSAVALISLSSVTALAALAQTMAPAPVLQIIRETNKEGKAAAHEKIENEWAAASRKANLPGRYVGFATMSGASEFWFFEPMPSFAISDEWQKAMDKEPVKTTMDNLDSRDGEVRASSVTYWAVYHPELSYKPEKFNPAKVRFIPLTTFRVKLEGGDGFTAMTKQYFDSMRKANIDTCVLTYQVIAGAPADTYLSLEMTEGIKTLDGMPARMQAVAQAMGPDNLSRFMKSAGDIFVSIQDTLLQVKPGMSYPLQAMVDADPAFWKPKAASAGPPAKKQAQQ
jgi:hypothetical protein